MAGHSKANSTEGMYRGPITRASREQRPGRGVGDRMRRSLPKPALHVIRAAWAPVRVNPFLHGSEAASTLWIWPWGLKPAGKPVHVIRMPTALPPVRHTKALIPLIPLPHSYTVNTVRRATATALDDSTHMIRSYSVVSALPHRSAR